MTAVRLPLLLSLTCLLSLSTVFCSAQNEQFPVSEFVEPSMPENTVKPGITGGCKPGDDATKKSNGSGNQNGFEHAPFLDIHTARFGRLEIDLEDTGFSQANVPRIHLLAEKMDLKGGTLQSLKIDVFEGKFQEFEIDRLAMYTHGGLQFDPASLLNQKILEFTTPADARAEVIISQNSLNHFLNHPETLKRLSSRLQHRVPFIGAIAGDVKFGVEFNGAHIQLQEEGRIQLDLLSTVGVSKLGLKIPVTVTTKLLLEDGWPRLTETAVTTKGQEFSPDLTEKIVSRVNSLSDAIQKTHDVKFIFTDIRIIPGERLELQGKAVIKRLRFGRSQDGSQVVEPLHMPQPLVELQQKPAKKQKTKKVKKEKKKKSKNEQLDMR